MSHVTRHTSHVTRLKVKDLKRSVKVAEGKIQSPTPNPQPPTPNPQPPNQHHFRNGIQERAESSQEDTEEVGLLQVWGLGFGVWGLGLVFGVWGFGFCFFILKFMHAALQRRTCGSTQGQGCL